MINCYNKRDDIMPKKSEIYYNKTNTCDRCGKNLTFGKTCKEYDQKGNWTKRWLCLSCYSNIRIYGTSDKDKIIQMHNTYNKNKPTYYNSTNTCDRCGNNLNNLISRPCREYDEQNNWNGKWLCANCYKYDCAKEKRDCRNKNLDPTSKTGKGYIFEQITCNVMGIENLNIKTGNFHSCLDHSRHPELGIIQSKGAIYDYICDQWGFNVKNEQQKEFDYIILYCMDIDMKNVSRVYIIPKKEIMKRKSISIIKNSLRHTRYEKYRVDEKPYNDAYHNIDIDKDPVLRRHNNI